MTNALCSPGVQPAKNCGVELGQIISKGDTETGNSGQLVKKTENSLRPRKYGFT